MLLGELLLNAQKKSSVEEDFITISKVLSFGEFCSDYI